jgi:hypothetical protein
VKPSGLDFLHLPVRVKFGFVGQLLLRAKMTKLTSTPVEVGPPPAVLSRASFPRSVLTLSLLPFAGAAAGCVCRRRAARRFQH